MLECSSAEMVSIRSLHCSAYTECMAGSCIHHADPTKRNVYIFAAERDGTEIGQNIKLDCPKTILVYDRTIL